jgi:hypothetical protein
MWEKVAGDRYQHMSVDDVVTSVMDALKGDLSTNVYRIDEEMAVGCPDGASTRLLPPPLDRLRTTSSKRGERRAQPKPDYGSVSSGLTDQCHVEDKKILSTQEL